LAIFRRHTSVLLSSQRSLFAGANFHAHLRHSSGAPSFPRNFHVDNLRKCLTRAGFDASLYAGHSFRRGMATWAELSARMDDGDIKIPGCWISDAVSVKLYQETTTSHVAHMAQMTLRPRAPSRTVLSPPPMLAAPALLPWLGRRRAPLTVAVHACQPARAEATVALLRHDRGGPCPHGFMDNRVKVTQSAIVLESAKRHKSSSSSS
jgi:hypothetical protein